MRHKSRSILIIGCIIAIGVTTVFVGRNALLTSLKQAIREKVFLLNKQNLHISYDTIYINWTYNEITAEKIVITRDMYDTTCVHPESVTVQGVTIKGFDILSYLFAKRFNIETITVDHPHLTIRRDSELISLDSAKGKNPKEAIINVDKVSFNDIELTYLDSGACELKTSLKTNASISHLNLLLVPGQRINYAFSELRIDSCHLVLPQSLYEFTMKSSVIDLNNRTMQVDTARIKPLEDKIAFGKAMGHEVDRFDGIIPFMKLNHFRFDFEDTLALTVEKLEAQIFLKVFRDKRLANVMTRKKLPMEALRESAIGIHIDTIAIKKSYVAYQEASADVPDGFTTSFDNLQAMITGVSNTDNSVDGKTLVTAQGNINGQGKIELECTAPWNPKSNYVASGVIRNVSMTKFNDALVPMANIKVESGVLEQLTFKFQFNNVRSDGHVTVEYKDVRLTSLRDDKEIAEIIKKNKWTKKDPEDYKVNPFKSFLLNTFVLKKDLDEKNADGVRNGDILFYRDPSKSVFNYMWKSVFSGVKNAYNIDKLQAKMESKKERKEKRKERRRQKNSGTKDNS